MIDKNEAWTFTKYRIWLSSGKQKRWHPGSWARPSVETYGSALNDEYTAELYYRYQMTQLFSVTPDIQYLTNPALNPDEENVLVVGLRGRLSF